MISLKSKVIIADNSGATIGQCIHTLGGSVVKYAAVGDTIVVVIKEATPGGKVAKSEIHKAVVVRTKQATRRPDGSYIKFNSNAVVLIDKKGEMIGTRVFGPIVREIRKKGYLKIASLAPEVL